MNELLKVTSVNRRFGGVRALSDVTVTLSEGETLGMIGPNGSGKTSFVNAVTGHLRLDSGTVVFDGKNITGIRPHKIAHVGLARTYQAVRVFSRLTVLQNIETAAVSVPNAEAILESDDCRAVLEWLKLDRRLGVLAGGLTLFEQRRLELAMRLVLKPKLVMLDEPVGGLAPSEVRAMMQVLQELKGRCSLFVIEHTMRVIRELADRVVVLITGEKAADGAPVEILSDRRVVEQYLGTPHA